MNSFTVLFLFMLAGTSLARIGLSLRQIRHVRAHRAAVPAAFANAIPLADHQKAADYCVARNHVAMADTLVQAAWVLLLTLGGGLQWLQQRWSELLPVGGIAHGVALIGTVMLLGALIELPVSIYSTFVIEARFGFNRSNAALFVADLGRSLLLGAAIALPLIALVLWLIEQLGTNWWIGTWIAWIAFSLLLMLAYPTLIAPLFNRFKPLQDESVVARVTGLLERCGFRSAGVFVMDGSRRSSHGNAYFTGFGAAKRIVFFDTLLERLDGDEIEAVLAHELGHYRLHHVIWRIVWVAASSLVLLALLGWVIDKPWFHAGLGLNELTIAAGLLLFMMVMPVFTFPLAPLSSMHSRKQEYQADAWAVRHAAAQCLVSALVKLYQDNATTLTPDPLYSTFHDSHPPATLRIARIQALA